MQAQDNRTDFDSTPPETAVPHTPRPVDGRGQPREIGGPKGLEPTRYGDWERKGRCIDF